MFFRLVADLVVVAHFTFIMFIAAGGMLAWRWPRLFWVHLPAFVYGAAIIGIGFTCPLTPLEKYFRRLGGESPYPGGFIDHYIKGHIYPAQLNALAQSLVAAAVVVGYAWLVRRQRARADAAQHRHLGRHRPADARRAARRLIVPPTVGPRPEASSPESLPAPEPVAVVRAQGAAGRARPSVYSSRRRQPATTPSPPSGSSARPPPVTLDKPAPSSTPTAS